jgi:hypothetical protein
VMATTKPSDAQRLAQNLTSHPVRVPWSVLR